MLNRKPKQSFKIGTKVTCIKSGSRFYTVGSIYEVVEKHGKVGVIGSDGMFDSFEHIISQFKDMNEDTKRKSQRKKVAAAREGQDNESP